MAWYRREYIGTVKGRTVVTDDDGAEKYQQVGRWILYIGLFGIRRAVLVGNPGGSPFADNLKAKVKAWELGGPLPKLDDDTRVKSTGHVLKLVKE